MKNRFALLLAFLISSCATVKKEPKDMTINESFEQHGAAISACYNQALEKVAAKDKAKFAGKVVVSATLDSAGKAAKTKIKESTLKNKEVEDCVLKNVNEGSYPPTERGSVSEVTYPYVFQTQQK
jgi:hypothetical protein